MKPFAALTVDELELLTALTRSHPVFRVYLRDAREATDAGAGNRSAMIGQEARGAALGIAFDTMEIRTIIGQLSPNEELAVADLPHAGELHIDEGAAGRIRGQLGDRVIATHVLQYYVLSQRPRSAPDPRCVRLREDRLQTVTDFFSAHYPQTIFSRWMLERRFLGIFERGELVACGGVVAAADGISNVGNFLTAPEARGRGLCRAVATTLAHQLFDEGMTQVTLGTTAGNPAACKAYEATGFRCFDRRLQLDLF